MSALWLASAVPSRRRMQLSSTAPAPSVAHRWLVAALAGLIAVVVAAPATAAEEEPGDPMIRGICLGLFFEEPGASYVSYLWEIRRTGANAVSFVLPWAQDTVHDSALSRDPVETPRDADVVAAVRAAHALGLEVMFLPIVHLRERRMGVWRGTLAPDDVDAWFQSYRAFLFHYLDIAVEHGVEIFSVGSELGSLEDQETRWRSLIAEVRGRYDGRVTYSANWDHYHHVSFWDAVDLLGVTGYYELAESTDAIPSEEELVAAWQPIVEALSEAARTSDRPVLITEIGYFSQATAARYPWDYTRGGEPDLEAQARLYRAMFRAWRDAPEFAGLFVWNWFGGGGAFDGGYSPRNKPAEDELRRGFRQWLAGSPDPSALEPGQ